MSDTLSPVCLSIKRNKDRCNRHKRPEILSAARECEGDIVYYEEVYPHGESTGTRQRSDKPLSSCLLDRSEVTGTLKQMVFIPLSAT